MTVLCLNILPVFDSAEAGAAAATATASVCADNTGVVAREASYHINGGDADWLIDTNRILIKCW